MITEENYSCTKELGAEVLIVFTSIIIIISVVCRWLCTAFGVGKVNRIISDQDASLLVSFAYNRSLSILSYIIVQREKHNQEVAQLIFIWMVLIEVIRVRNDNYSTWKLKKSIQQLFQLLWVSYLVYSHKPRQLIMTSLFVMCVFFIVFEVLHGIAFHKAKNSYLIGKNPKLIQTYVERKMRDHDLHTTPMNICNYIVMGEENHRIVDCSNGCCLLHQNRMDGLFTINRAFLSNLHEGEAFTSAISFFRNTCLSLALAKMLMRRFARLPVVNEEFPLALSFVINGLIEYIGHNRDIQPDGQPDEIVGERNPERVFSIIQEELKFVSDFLHIKVPIYHYFGWYNIVDRICVIIAICNGFYLLYIVLSFKSSTWKSLVAQEAYNHCVFHWIRRSSVVVEIIPCLHKIITVLLVLAYISIQFPLSTMAFPSKRWSNLKSIEMYSRNDARWNRSFANCMMNVLPTEEARVYSILDVSIFARLPYCIRRIVPRSSPIVLHSTDAKEAILRYFMDRSVLTNEHTILGNYQGPTGAILLCGTTEAILVWHIATSLLHHQEPAPQQNNNLVMVQEVALALSSYCLYLVTYLPEIIPDEVEWTKSMYESTIKEILAIPQNEDRRNYVLQSTWGPMSVVGKGARLAKDLISPQHETPVWTTLAKYWEEMMMFLAASGNVEVHEKILDREELITQLWALLTHAGILTWSQPSWNHDHEH